jgi:hypothetical protein
MTSTWRLSRAARRLAASVAAMLVLTASAAAARPVPQPPDILDRSTTEAVTALAGAPTAEAPDARPVPADLTSPGLDLRAGAVDVPIVLHLPSLGLQVPVLGVGITPAGAMDAPVGAAADPVWQKAFWYRGSAVPGAPSTAVIAGHVMDSRGRAGAFGTIDRLRIGDPILVRDTRTGLDVVFAVTGTTTYPLAETSDPTVLTKIYGAGPVNGTPPQASVDGLAHLTLITCAGVFKNHTHDHRLVVDATRTG